jgi:hypothetical protein
MSNIAIAEYYSQIHDTKTKTVPLCSAYVQAWLLQLIFIHNFPRYPHKRDQNFTE